MLTGCASATTTIPAGTLAGYNAGKAGETYLLAGDGTSTGTAIYVGANNLTIDLQGHTITYATTTNAPGISNNGYDGVTIKNGTLISATPSFGSARGIVFMNSAMDGYLENLHIESGASYGLYGIASGNLTVNDSVIISTTNAGVYTNGFNGLTANNCSISSHDSYGAYFQSSPYCSLYKCNVNSIRSTSLYYQYSDYGTVDSTSVYSERGIGTYFNVSNYGKMLNSTSNASAKYATYFLNSNNCTGQDSTSMSSISNGIMIKNSNGDILNNFTGSSVSNIGVYAEDSDGSNFDTVICKSTQNCGLKLNRVYNFTHANIIVDSLFATTSPGSKIQILNVGNSITEGNADPSVAGGYGRYVESSLGPGYKVSIQGVGGDHAEILDREIDYKLDIFKPKAVIIGIGTNCLFDNEPQQSIIDSILDTAAKCKAYGATPYILTILPRGTTPDAKTIAIDTALTEQATAAGYTVIPIHDVLDSTPYNGVYDSYVNGWYLDQVHPTNAGNALLGPFIARNILAASKTFFGYGLAHSAYSNGSFSNSRAVYPTDDIANFSVVPAAGVLTFNINTWDKSGDYVKTWTESTPTSSDSTHAIGDFPANVPVQIDRDGVSYAYGTTNSTGYLNWVYSGGYSDHSFKAFPVPTFFMSASNGYTPLTENLNATTYNVTAWYWDYENDGKIDSTDINTSHIYWTPGNYTVNLTMTTKDGNNISILKTVTVSYPGFWADATAKFNWISTWLKLSIAGVISA